MKHLFVPYEIAVELKKKGFDEECLASATDKIPYEGYHYMTVQNSEDPKNSKWAALPLYQQVVDWFREDHRIMIVVDADSLLTYKSYTYKFGDKFDSIVHREIKSYYEALHGAIEEALKLI